MRKMGEDKEDSSWRIWKKRKKLYKIRKTKKHEWKEVYGLRFGPLYVEDSAFFEDSLLEIVR